MVLSMDLVQIEPGADDGVLRISGAGIVTDTVSELVVMPFSVTVRNVGI